MAEGIITNKRTAHYNSHKLIRVVKWIVLISSYSYLLYLLIHYDKYTELSAELSYRSAVQLWWLTLAIVFLPLNLTIEASKWKYIVSKSQTLSTKNSIKSVLLGFSTGFLTPNRAGDMLGRMSFLTVDNRKQGIGYSLLNSYSLTLVLTVCGLPASIMLYVYTKDLAMFGADIKLYLGAVMLGSFLAIVAYFELPRMLKHINNKKVQAFSQGLQQYSRANLLQILLFSLMRYMVFCFQFYAVLHFFGVHLELWQAFIAIPANYLFVSFTPSLAISETAIRSSYAVILIGVFSDQIINIALAGTLIWLLNYGLPMLAGSYLLVKGQKA